jgi:hypothetical protein
METLQAFTEWAWARHHNPLSWYIRPLFLLPYCYFAWRHSLMGMVATVVALATSMFWFPAPADPDPRAVEFLEAERDYLLGPWNSAKVFFTALVSLFFVSVGLAFWHRSILIGLVAMNAASLVKIGWSFYYGGSSGWTVVAPAVVGPLIVNIAALIANRRWGQQLK